MNKFLPRNNFPLPLDPKRPVQMGDFAPPAIYTEAKWAQEVKLRRSKETIIKAWDEFAKAFGRQYNPVETYYGDAGTLIYITGSFAETAMTAVDQMREAGDDVGLVRLRLWRPFPFEELRAAVKNTDLLVTIDRAISFGGPGGAICSEIKAALYNEPKKPAIVSFVAGLGGRDIQIEHFKEIVQQGCEIAKNGSDNEYEMFRYHFHPIVNFKLPTPDLFLRSGYTSRFKLNSFSAFHFFARKRPSIMLTKRFMSMKLPPRSANVLI